MPQPIDPTTEISRTAAVERLQQLTARTDLHMQAQQASALARQQHVLESEVDQAEGKRSEVERDLRRRNPYRGKRRPKPNPPTEETRTFYTAGETKTMADDDEHHGLDVKI